MSEVLSAFLPRYTRGLFTRDEPSPAAFWHEPGSTTKRPARIQRPALQNIPETVSAEQTQTEKARWMHYLANLPQRPVGLDAEHARAVRRVWSMLEERVPGLRLPAAGPGGDLGFQLTWNLANAYVEIDIGPDGAFEWFWRDPETERFDGSDDERMTAPDEALIRLLVRCCLP